MFLQDLYYELINYLWNESPGTLFPMTGHVDRRKVLCWFSIVWKPIKESATWWEWPGKLIHVCVLICTGTFLSGEKKTLDWRLMFLPNCINLFYWYILYKIMAWIDDNMPWYTVGYDFWSIPNSSDGPAKTPVKLWHGWVVKAHGFMWIYLYIHNIKSMLVWLLYGSKRSPD